jgi:hypothetical protein
VIGIVTGHLSTGQNLNFGLTVKALAAVIAKLRPILHERPLVLGLPAPLRPTLNGKAKINTGTKLHTPPDVNPNKSQQQVTLYDKHPNVRRTAHPLNSIILPSDSLKPILLSWVSHGAHTQLNPLFAFEFS